LTAPNNSLERTPEEAANLFLGINRRRLAQNRYKARDLND